MSRDDNVPRRAPLDAPPTQVVADRETYLGQGRHDVGRRIAQDQVELFVSSDVASALQGEFQQHASEFIALHDVGTRAALRLLNNLASASAAPVQRLTVRRQGQGLALAVLRFVDVVLSDDSHVRVYATDIEADSPTRQRLAPLLLSCSRLGVLMVGELPPHAMTSALTPLHDALARGPWPNRELLVVPVGASTALAAQATWLAGRSGVEIRVTPSAAKARSAWAYVAGAWNRSNGQGPGARAMQTELDRAVRPPPPPLAEAATERMGLDPLVTRPSPTLPGALPRRVAAPVAPMSPSGRPKGEYRSAQREGTPVSAAVNAWQPFADRCSGIQGLVACCIFDVDTRRTLAQSGWADHAAGMAQQGATLLAQMQVAARVLAVESAPAEAVISTGTHHLLLRHLSGHAGVAVHLVLRADQTTPSQARADLNRIAPPV